eukprot:TRINITY_DN6495_c0_g2_i1.p1 TRINITY_DN6495_c0_g2~~TRINITY_DN6495_c0_g2_i1.p1  ORF type:complete len:1881 (+),score=352.69 TRINITY_DN6495_c0_g2_i1:121-5763(+)
MTASRCVVGALGPVRLDDSKTIRLAGTRSAVTVLHLATAGLGRTTDLWFASHGISRSPRYCSPAAARLQGESTSLGSYPSVVHAIGRSPFPLPVAHNAPSTLPSPGVAGASLLPAFYPCPTIGLESPFFVSALTGSAIISQTSPIISPRSLDIGPLGFRNAGEASWRGLGGLRLSRGMAKSRGSKGPSKKIKRGKPDNAALAISEKDVRIVDKTRTIERARAHYLQKREAKGKKKLEKKYGKVDAKPKENLRFLGEVEADHWSTFDKGPMADGGKVWHGGALGNTESRGAVKRRVLVGERGKLVDEAGRPLTRGWPASDRDLKRSWLDQGVSAVQVGGRRKAETEREAYEGGRGGFGGRRGVDETWEEDSREGLEVRRKLAALAKRQEAGIGLGRMPAKPFHDLDWEMGDKIEELWKKDRGNNVRAGRKERDDWEVVDRGVRRGQRGWQEREHEDGRREGRGRWEDEGGMRQSTGQGQRQERRMGGSSIPFEDPGRRPATSSRRDRDMVQPPYSREQGSDAEGFAPTEKKLSFVERKRRSAVEKAAGMDGGGGIGLGLGQQTSQSSSRFQDADVDPEYSLGGYRGGRASAESQQAMPRSSWGGDPGISKAFANRQADIEFIQESMAELGAERVNHRAVWEEEIERFAREEEAMKAENKGRTARQGLELKEGTEGEGRRVREERERCGDGDDVFRGEFDLQTGRAGAARGGSEGDGQVLVSEGLERGSAVGSRMSDERILVDEVDARHFAPARASGADSHLAEGKAPAEEGGTQGDGEGIGFRGVLGGGESRQEEGRSMGRGVRHSGTEEVVTVGTRPVWGGGEGIGRGGKPSASRSWSGVQKRPVKATVGSELRLAEDERFSDADVSKSDPVKGDVNATLTVVDSPPLPTERDPDVGLNKNGIRTANAEMLQCASESKSSPEVVTLTIVPGSRAGDAAEHILTRFKDESRAGQPDECPSNFQDSQNAGTVSGLGDNSASFTYQSQPPALPGFPTLHSETQPNELSTPFLSVSPSTSQIVPDEDVCLSSSNMSVEQQSLLATPEGGITESVESEASHAISAAPHDGALGGGVWLERYDAGTGTDGGSTGGGLSSFTFDYSTRMTWAAKSFAAKGLSSEPSGGGMIGQQRAFLGVDMFRGLGRGTGTLPHLAGGGGPRPFSPGVPSYSAWGKPSSRGDSRRPKDRGSGGASWPKEGAGRGKGSGERGGGGYDGPPEGFSRWLAERNGSSQDDRRDERDNGRGRTDAGGSRNSDVQRRGDSRRSGGADRGRRGEEDGSRSGAWGRRGEEGGSDDGEQDMYEGNNDREDVDDGMYPRWLRGEVVYGISPIRAALYSCRRRFFTLYVQEGLEFNLGPKGKRKDKVAVKWILDEASRMRVKIMRTGKHELNLLSGNRPHQGLVLDATPLELEPLESLPGFDPDAIAEEEEAGASLKAGGWDTEAGGKEAEKGKASRSAEEPFGAELGAGHDTDGGREGGEGVGEVGRAGGGEQTGTAVESEKPLPVWVALDEVVDPQNLGAILRSSHFLGAEGVVVCTKNSAPLSAVVGKASSGAMETMEIRSCRNMSRFLQRSADAGWLVVGASADADAIPITLLPRGMPTLLVLGNEGAGLRTNVKRACSHLVRITGAGTHVWELPPPPLIDEEEGGRREADGAWRGEEEEGGSDEDEENEEGGRAGKGGTNGGARQGVTRFFKPDETRTTGNKDSRAEVSSASEKDDVTPVSAPVHGSTRDLGDSSQDNSTMPRGEERDARDTGAVDPTSAALAQQEEADSDATRATARENALSKLPVRRHLDAFQLVDSLNVGVAAGILLHELLARQREVPFVKASAEWKEELGEGGGGEAGRRRFGEEAEAEDEQKAQGILAKMSRLALMSRAKGADDERQ